MSRAIWKYDAPQPGAKLEIEMPIDSRIILVGQVQIDGQMGDWPKGVFWAEVFPHASKECRNFYTIGTGDDYPDEPTWYVGTWIDYPRREVWHLLEAQQTYIGPPMGLYKQP